VQRVHLVRRQHFDFTAFMRSAGTFNHRAMMPAQASIKTFNAFVLAAAPKVS